MAASGIRAAERLAGLAVYVQKRFRADGAFDMASSLSYTSLLSLVPLMAIALAILAAFPVFDGVRDTLQATLFRYVVPEVGEQVQSYVGEFVKNAGKLTAAGVIGLGVSAVLVLVSIESSLNQIFRVVTPRTALSRLLVYWTALTLGPLMLAASFSLSAWLYAASDWATRAGLWRLVRLVTHAAPGALLMVAFALLYLSVPNRRVRVADCGGRRDRRGLAFASLRWGFGLYVASAQTLSIDLWRRGHRSDLPVLDVFVLDGRLVRRRVDGGFARMAFGRERRWAARCRRSAGWLWRLACWRRCATRREVPVSDAAVSIAGAGGRGRGRIVAGARALVPGQLCGRNHAGTLCAGARSRHCHLGRSGSLAGAWSDRRRRPARPGSVVGPHRRRLSEAARAEAVALDVPLAVLVEPEQEGTPSESSGA